MLQKKKGSSLAPTLRWLKDGPLSSARKYDACLINGFRFHTLKIEQCRRTQNSGVVLNATTSSETSGKDRSPIHGEVSYYGMVNEIIELNYYGQMTTLLFRCDWIDVRRGVKEDKAGFILVNPKYLLKLCEPFVLASQVRQVWYVEDPKEHGWYVVRKTQPRDSFDVDGGLSISEGDILDIQPTHEVEDTNVDENDVDLCWERNDLEWLEINLKTVQH